MKYLFTLLCCVMISSAFAETINDVEYHLPTVAREWESVDKVESAGTTTLFYLPRGEQRLTSQESFVIHANQFPFNINDVSSLVTNINEMFPHMQVKLQILEKGNHSVLYEWSAEEHGHEKVHGWGRAFSTRDGTVILGYQTKKISEVSKARVAWLPMLKAARFKH